MHRLRRADLMKIIFLYLCIHAHTQVIRKLGRGLSLHHQSLPAHRNQWNVRVRVNASGSTYMCGRCRSSSVGPRPMHA